MTLSIEVIRHVHNGVTTMSLSGGLTYRAVPKVRSTLLKCASECPTGVVVDLAGLERADDAAFSVFAAASHKSLRDWGVPIVLSGAGTEITRQLAPFRAFTIVCGTRHAALIVLRTWAPRWVHMHLANDPESVHKATSLVGDACLAWDVIHMRTAARLVMSELVTNAITHTDTDVGVTTSFTGRYLRVAVHDGSAVLPRLVPDDPDASPSDHRPGLHLVRDTATRWGTTRLADGKIVWALLVADP